MAGARFLRLVNFRRLYCSKGSPRRLRILGIETSCDDTGVAVVDSDRKILGEANYSQADVHALHGGILPPVASDLHRGCIREAVEEALEQSQLSCKDLDGIAVTVKPGIATSLEVGIEHAKNLCTLYSKPLIPIHHMEAHALTVRMLEDVEFPFLVLLTSGGNCILAVAESVTEFVVLGEAQGIAPGVVLDKISRRLKLRTIKGLVTMQGGQAIETVAEKGNPFDVPIDILTQQARSCNFHFSGFETGFIRFIEKEEKRLKVEANEALPNVHDICARIQYLMFKYICQRLEIGMHYLEGNKMSNLMKRTLVVSGGVAANGYFRRMLKHVCDHTQYKLIIPPKSLCTDNGVMIAWNGIERLRTNVQTVGPNEFHLVEASPWSKLGKNISEDVAAFPWKGKYTPLSKLMKQEYMEKAEPMSKAEEVS